jgi:hypothetical protein
MSPLKRRVTIGLFVVALAAAACGGGSSSTSTSTKPSRGFTGTTARGGEPDVKIGDQALLLRDNTIFLNDIDYTCPANQTGWTIAAAVNQNGTRGFSAGSPATCDGAFHTAYINVGPSVFIPGVMAVATAYLSPPNSSGPYADSPITPRTADPRADDVVTINNNTTNNHALLLTDGSVVLSVSYRCVPGPGPNTAGTLDTWLNQGKNSSYGAPKASAVCDDRSHTVSARQVGTGPYSEGSAQGYAFISDAVGQGVNAGGGQLTISSSTAAHAPARR